MRLDVVEYEFRANVYEPISGNEEIGLAHVLTGELAKVALVRSHHNNRLERVRQ